MDELTTSVPGIRVASRLPDGKSNGKGTLPDGYCACPIDTTFAVIGKKWSLQIIRSLLEGHRQFSHFLQQVEGINPKSLSARLKDLEREKLIVKRVVGTSPIKIHYELTEKGFSVLPILRGMARWSFQWAPDKVFEAGRAPATIERCLEDWQTSLMSPNAQLKVTKGREVVAVSFRPQKPRRGTA